MKEKCYTMYDVECEQKPFVGKVKNTLTNKLIFERNCILLIVCRLLGGHTIVIELTLLI